MKCALIAVMLCAAGAIAMTACSAVGGEKVDLVAKHLDKSVLIVESKMQDIVSNNNYACAWFAKRCEDNYSPKTGKTNDILYNDYLPRAFKDFGVSDVCLFNSDGKDIIDVKYGTIKRQDLIEQAHDGKEVHGLVVTDGAVQAISVLPLRIGGKIAGVVGVKTNVSTDEWAKEMALYTSSRFAVYDGYTRSFTSIQGAKGTTIANKNTIDQVMQTGKPVVEKMKILGEMCTSVFAPIVGAAGNTLAVYSISLSSDDIKAIKKMARENGAKETEPQDDTANDTIWRGIDTDSDEAVEHYTKAAEGGDVEAKYKLGRHYFYYAAFDKENAEQYYLDASTWYAQAADAGHTGAQYELGSVYENGDGVKKDYSKAIEYFTCLSEAGETRPQYDLAVCYANSADTADNRAQSAKWYKEAANNGNENAQYVIGECYYKGHGVEKDYQAAVQWWRKAAEHGDSRAQYYLGVCYANGQGVEQDNGEAAKWYTGAKNSGYSLGKSAQALIAKVKQQKAKAEEEKRKAEEKQRQAEAERRLIASAIKGFTYHGSDEEEHNAKLFNYEALETGHAYYIRYSIANDDPAFGIAYEKSSNRSNSYDFGHFVSFKDQKLKGKLAMKAIKNGRRYYVPVIVAVYENFMYDPVIVWVPD